MDGLQTIDARETAGREFRYFDFVMVAFVVILLLSNVIGAGKPAVVDLPFIGAWPFGAGILFFPLSYLIGDILTEVYGYARARRCVWAGFAGLIFMAFMEQVVVALPPASGWTGQASYEYVFGKSIFVSPEAATGLRIILASITAFWVGEFANSFVLAKLKILTNGRMLWTRTVGSTVVAQGFDSLIFYPLAFYGMTDWPAHQIAAVMLSQFVLKVSWEILLTPVTYLVVNFLKRREGVEVFDRGTDFSPFKARV
jgi:uncharacterized integral membrane protein (TIGR00697 family)